MSKEPFVFDGKTYCFNTEKLEGFRDAIEICWGMFGLWAAGNPAYLHLPVELWEALKKIDEQRYMREFDQAVFGREL